MADTEVQVIKATEGPIVRDRRLVGTPLTLQRKRVAAYVRVSTDGEEQLQSFQSQKQYYQDKISKKQGMGNGRDLCRRRHYGNENR